MLIHYAISSHFTLTAGGVVFESEEMAHRLGGQLTGPLGRKRVGSLKYGNDYN